MPGRHNWQNIAAAYAACHGLGLERREILEALPRFPGLEHRQEFIAEIDGVRFVNDSKATNAEATAKALACYRPIYWILGGRAKETGLAGLEPFYLAVAEAFLIGEASERFERELKGTILAQRCGTMQRAVEAAFAAARRDRRNGAVVLLSPAAASFDQYNDFEERGHDFRRAVEALERAP
jgi:UDP-N-acetylmuramoylalanine--D-glutamate ligase